MSNLITKADLSTVIEPIRLILYCPECSSEWSATPSDYWQYPDTHLLICLRCDQSLRLVRKRTVYEDWNG